MIFLECKDYGKKPINFLFTGDYKMKNPFFKVPKLPKWVTKKKVILIHESTYGTTTQDEIKKCFISNLLEAFERKQDVLIGGFAQGRFQEVLYDLRKLEDQNLIPEDYEIWMDGPLGIGTTYIYKEIFEEFYPDVSDFIPKRAKEVDPKSREQIATSEKPKIIVTTSGMLSNGPAKLYVPLFIERSNAMIHLIGYAAEETLARNLLESKRAETIKIGGHVYQKRAIVKTTREKTSHATMDEMIDFINTFDDVEFLGINHGEEETKFGFEDKVKENCPNVKETGVLNRTYAYCIYQFGDKYDDIKIKKIPAKLQVVSPTVVQKQKEKKKIKRQEKQRIKASKKAAKRKRKSYK